MAFLVAGCNEGKAPLCLTNVACDDGNPCTNDTCDKSYGCIHTDNELPCDDGNACTKGDVCTAGVCLGTMVDCDDGNVCTDDSCDPAGGCQHLPNNLSCDDGDACTIGDQCGNGFCQPGSGKPDCDEGNPCTDDRCDPVLGCVHADNLAPCDDGSACTAADVCTGGHCIGVPISCDDKNPCTDDFCDPHQGCVHSNNLAPCDDGDACTLGDTCALGNCQSGASHPDCDDHNLCTDDHCDPHQGCVHSNNLAPCDDGDACTLGDACSGGECVGGTGSPNCDDHNLCTADSCAPANGCVNTDISSSCDDGNGCTRDSCDPAAGCVHRPCSGYSGCLSDACVCNTGYQGDGFDCLPVCGDGECAAGEDFLGCPQDCQFDLLVVIEADLLAGLQASLDQYVADLASEGHRAYLVSWTWGTAADLRVLLQGQFSQRAISGALFIGDLPTAWYEQVAFGVAEEFPFELYFMDLDATFTDTDANGKFDAHSDLNLEIFVSRLLGTEAELQGYFTRAHDYRVNGPQLPVAAFNFMDDDWSGYPGTYGLEYIYKTIDLLTDPAATTKDAYLQRLTGSGVEFVFQWIHSTPTYMHIYGTGEGYIDTNEVASENHRASFINMFNCSAARFTEPNLAITYLAKTDHVLAIVGSTKVGGMVTPRVFHGGLGAGLSWGESYRKWYNENGKTDDSWFLGMVILGDPMLHIAGDANGLIAAPPEEALSAEQRDQLRRIMVDEAKNFHAGTFAQYRAGHKSFFP